MTPFENYRRGLWMASGGAGLTVLLLLSLPLFMGMLFFGLDHSLIDQGVDCALRQQFHHSDSLWLSPFLGNGAPFAMRPSVQFFYPLRWLTFLFPSEFWTSLNAVFHIAWAASGSALLVSSFRGKPWTAYFAGLLFWGGFLGESMFLGRRAGGLTIAESLHWSFLPHLWIATLIPPLENARSIFSVWGELFETAASPWRYSSWNPNPYLGLTIVSLCIPGLFMRRSRTATIAIVIGLLLASGSATSFGIRDLLSPFIPSTPGNQRRNHLLSNASWVVF